MNNQLLESQCICCLDGCVMTVDVREYCVPPSLDMYMRGDTLEIPYMTVLNLNDDDFQTLLTIGETDAMFYFHIAMILFLLDVEGSCASVNDVHSTANRAFFDRLVDFDVEPYVKIQQSHLDRMLDNGNIAAYLHTVSNIVVNNNIDVDMNRVQVSLLEQLVERMRTAPSNQWLNVIAEFMKPHVRSSTSLAYRSELRDIETRNTKVWEILNRATFGTLSGKRKTIGNICEDYCAPSMHQQKSDCRTNGSCVSPLEAFNSPPSVRTSMSVSQSQPQFMPPTSPGRSTGRTVRFS